MHDTLSSAPMWLWVLLHALLALLMLADILLTRRATMRAPAAGSPSTTYWLAGMWIAAALLFGLLLARALSPQLALQYFTGYGIELALSIDNLFVFLLLFRAFHLNHAQRRRVLFAGIVGAIVMRGLMIAAGVQLLNRFAWINYVFGAILLFAAAHLLRGASRKQQQGPPSQPKWVGWLAKLLPLATEQHGNRFFVVENGRCRCTILFLALLAIELTDVAFATDSISAVLAVSHHGFVVYSSNIFAVVGLRSLYFTLAASIERLHRIRYGLAAILCFVGAEMLLAHRLSIPAWVSLAFVVFAVAVTAAWSFASKPEVSSSISRNR